MTTMFANAMFYEARSEPTADSTNFIGSYSFTWDEVSKYFLVLLFCGSRILAAKTTLRVQIPLKFYSLRRIFEAIRSWTVG